MCQGVGCEAALKVCELLCLYAGAGDKVFRQTAAGNIAVDCVNKAWRSPNAPRAAAQGEDKEAMDEEDEAWLDAVNAQAIAKQ